MGIMRVQVILPKTSALPADAITNTFHFTTGGAVTEAAATEACEALESFYSTIRPYIGNDIAFANARCKAYDLGDPEPRAPIADHAFTTTGSNTGDPLPAECALTVSWEADMVSGGIAARRRGRTFLGTLDRATQKLGDRGRIDDAVVDAVSSAAGALASFAGALTQLAVYSPTDGLARDVTGGWVDNAYDTVRSRGVSPTYRNPF